MKQVILLAICAFGLFNLNIRSQSSDDLSISSEDTLSDLGQENIIDVIMMGDIDEMKKLIKNGVDVNLQDEALGNTALMWAADFEYNDIAKLLLDNNADVNIQNKNGYTALIYAARMGRRVIVKMLLEKGANIDLKTNEGDTALALASKLSHDEGIANLLKLEEEIKKSVSIKPYLDNSSKKYLAWLENLRLYINNLSEEDLVWLIDRVVRNRNVGTLQLSDIEGLLPETYNKLIGIYKKLKSGSISEERIRNIFVGKDDISELLRKDNKKIAYRLLRNYLEKILDLSKAEGGIPLDVAAKIVFEY